MYFVVSFFKPFNDLIRYVESFTYGFKIQYKLVLIKKCHYLPDILILDFLFLQIYKLLKIGIFKKLRIYNFSQIFQAFFKILFQQLFLFEFQY